MAGRKVNPVARGDTPELSAEDFLPVVDERVERARHEPRDRSKRGGEDRAPREVSTASAEFIGGWRGLGHPGSFGLANKADRGT